MLPYLISHFSRCSTIWHQEGKFVFRRHLILFLMVNMSLLGENKLVFIPHHLNQIVLFIHSQLGVGQCQQAREKGISYDYVKQFKATLSLFIMSESVSNC